MNFLAWWGAALSTFLAPRKALGNLAQSPYVVVFVGYTADDPPVQSALLPQVHLGRDEYPLGFCTGCALNVLPFFPHFEQRSRFATSSSRVSHPHNWPNMRGSAVRRWPHSEHSMVN
jgi:hypothetical protein